jgi:osmotically-inducible protein OsmY
MAAGTHTDEETRQMVIDELYWDGRVDPADIRVQAHDRRVVLTGTVPTYAALGAAEEDTRSVAGAENVDNRLAVKQPVHALVPADQELESNVTSTLRRHSQIEAADIRVMVNDGRVTLKGTVPSYWQKVRAQDVAAGPTGVGGVTNELAVVPSKKHEDREIAEKIMAALERNGYVGSHQVAVKVNNGVVTLKGTVSDRRAYRVARAAARYTAGVVDVVNELMVEE